MNRPPYRREPGIPALYAHGARGRRAGGDASAAAASRAAGRMAISLRRMGCRRWTGWAVPGRGAHASHEHILWQHLAPRAALMAGLLETLD